MNKKILSIFALIMAISIFGVSCADNNTTNPTPTTPIISADDAKKVVNAIGDNIGSTAFTFSTATVSGDNDKYTVSLQDATTSSEVDSDAFLTAVKGKISAMQTASENKITIAEDDIKIAVDQQNKKKATVTITYKSKDGKKSGTITMNLELTNSGSPSFANPKLVLTPTKGIKSDALTVDLAQALTIDLAEAISETGVTYEVTAVAALNASTITKPTTSKDLSAGTKTQTETKGNYTVKDTVITIADAVKTELIGTSSAAGSLGTAGATGGIEITLTASKTGYKDMTDLKIYVVLTGYEAE